MLTSTEQYITGKEVEATLDDFFRGRGWQIIQTTKHQERTLCKGDRKFIRRDKVYFVEYKSGIQTYYTGNVFLETVSVDTTGAPGWVYTCQANFILYAALLNHKILVFRPPDLRDRIEGLKRIFPTKKTGKGQNQGYDTYGVIVPLAYAEARLSAATMFI